jgi:TonB family protein
MGGTVRVQGTPLEEPPPRPVTRVAPDYPEDAWNLGIRGGVRVAVLVGPAGTVDSAKVVGTSLIGDSAQWVAFEKAAVRAARRWRFQPATTAGKPVRAWTTLDFDFEPRPGCRMTEHRPFPPADETQSVDRRPEPILLVPPDYPAMTKSVRVEGTVLIRALVCEHGRVVKAIVAKSEAPVLNEGAVRAMVRCTYRPAERHGMPVAAWVDVPFEFKLH